MFLPPRRQDAEKLYVLGGMLNNIIFSLSKDIQNSIIQPLFTNPAIRNVLVCIKILKFIKLLQKKYYNTGVITMALNDIDYLYHYTTPAGLIGIVENRILWATDVFYLNDSEEFALGIQIARNYLKSKLEDRTNNESKIGRLEWLLGQLKNIGPSRKTDVYVSSLSEEDDQLSQWRAYCSGGGFAIGFKYGKIKELTLAQQFVLEQCIYERDEQEALINEAVDSTIETWLNSDFPWPEKEGEGPRFEIHPKLVGALSRLSPRLKNKGFVEEKEYRLISKPSYSFVEGQVKFRNQRGLVVPYRQFDIDDDDLWRKVRVVVGPTPHPEESKASVYQLLRGKTGYAHSIALTKCSFREW